MTPEKVVSTSTTERTRILRTWAVIICVAILSTTVRASTIVWNGSSGTDSNWSTAGNWLGGVQPGSADNVQFFDLGSNTTAGVINNTVDSGFSGTISSLQYGNTNGFHTTLITNGTTLNITGAGGLTVGTLTDNGASQIVTATITGSGALNFNNTGATLFVNQGRAANGTGSLRATLDMSSLASFNANIGSVSVGSALTVGNNAQNATGTIKLAQTNVITTSLPGSSINALTATPTNAITVGSDNGNAGGVDFLFLGQSNEFFIDSIGVGTLKTTASMLFNTGLSSPVAYFRGTNGPNSRVRFWTIGDMSSSGSSTGGANGTNDFTGGTVDALVDTMSLGRDRQGTATGTTITKGTLTFTSGTIDANNVFIGNQQWTNTGNLNPVTGVMNVSGPTAVLKVNTNLFIGRTSTNNGAALKTLGTLNIVGGTVYANTVSVGPVAVTNIINMVNGTLIVSNTLATNGVGLFQLNVSNSTLGLTIPTNGTLRGLALTLNTTGPTNLIQLGNSDPVIFPVYPTNISLIHYTNWTGSNVFGLASVPPWAPNATIVSNGPNQTVDLSLPTSPAPIITGQPTGYSGSPGDNVTTNFAVVVADGSGATLSYFWYFTDGATFTNLLSDGFGPSGTSTISNTATANMVMTNAQPGDNGNYFVVVSNIYGVVTSSVAVLDISSGCVAPQITGPFPQTVIQGNNATFTATVTANPAAYQQWQRGGVDIPGQNGSTLIVTNVQYPADDQAVFSLWATNSCGAQTNNATLTVIVPPVITNQPVSVVVTNGNSASFTVVAGGVPAPTYQWYKNALANPISGANSATLNFPAAAPTDTATYFVVVQNPAGSVTSTNVTLTVNSAMSAVSMIPANGASGICYDTPLTIVFDRPPTLNNIGTIKIYDVTNSSTPVDTVNLALGSPQPRTIGGAAFNSYPVIISNNTAVIYPHLDLLTSNQTYYVTVDDGAFTDSTGAYFAGVAANAWQFTTKSGGPLDPVNPVVAADGSADFLTVQGAVDSLPTSGPSLRTIHINNGNYVEIVNVAKTNITFRGQTRTGTVINYANNNNINPSTGTRMTFHVNAAFVAIENLTIVNTTPQGGSQAEALMIDSPGNHFILNNAEVDSRQDTILANSGTTQGYFYNTLVQGNFDYIWGGGNLFITNCQFNTITGTSGPNLTAARTQNGNTGNWPGYLGNLVSNGFSFVECQLTRTTGQTNTLMADHNGQTNGLVSFINCTIDTGGYTNADQTAQTSQLLWDYGCTDTNGTPLDNTASPFLSFVQIPPTTSNYMAAISVTNWLNGWMPSLLPNIISQSGNQTVNANQPASFSVAATGIPDPTYQWVMNGTNVLTDQTNATLTIANASGFDIGSYAAVISNGAGSVTSSVVTLSVIPPATGPTMLTPAVQANGDVQFTISGVPGSAGFGYRVWATTNLTLTPVTNTWTLLTNDVFGASPTTFIDATATATGARQRFYVITVP